MVILTFLKIVSLVWYFTFSIPGIWGTLGLDPVAITIFFAEYSFPLIVIEFFETNRLTFHSKIELYKQFLKEYESEWLNQNPNLFETLEEIKQMRNNFAHGTTLSEEDIKQIKKPKIPLMGELQ